MPTKTLIQVQDQQQHDQLEELLDLYDRSIITSFLASEPLHYAQKRKQQQEEEQQQQLEEQHRQWQQFEVVEVNDDHQYHIDKLYREFLKQHEQVQRQIQSQMEFHVDQQQQSRSEDQRKKKKKSNNNKNYNLNSNSNSNSNSNNRHNYILFDPKDLLTNKKRQENQFVLPFSLGDGLEVKLSDVTEEDEQPQEEEKEVECFSPTSVLSNDNQAEEKAQIQAEIHSSKDLIVEDVRKKVIQEICTTEKTYVSCIRTLYASYIVPLEETSHPIIQDAQIAVFFNNLRQLVMLNSKLLNDLTEILKQREEKIKKDRVFKGHLLTKTIALQAEGVGEMFCRYAPLFKLYSGYAKDYEDVARLLVGYKKDTRLGFAAFLEKCQKRSNCEKSFESLLILPIQRIPRYKLLLERLLRHTPNGHFDKVYLTEAVSRVAFATSLINETVRRQENLEMLLQTQMQFMGQMSLFNPERSLVKSGKLTKISTKKQEQVVLHLFNDILLYSAIVSLTGGYRIRRVVHLNSRAVHVSDQVPLTHTALLIASKNLKHDCGFVVASKEKTFILFTSTSEEKKEWVNCLQKTITDSQAKFSINPISANNKSTSHEISGGTKGPSDLLLVQETPSDAAALWVPDAVAGACTICHAGFKLYFRRHHCRRCGAVVCGNCSNRRSILYVSNSSKEERVCNPCYKVLALVKIIAIRWVTKRVEFKGMLRRKRWHKWSESYYELKGGKLKQYSLQGRYDRVCTDVLDLTGAIVIHRSDSRAQKNRFCFQISTSNIYQEVDMATTKHLTDGFVQEKKEVKLSEIGKRRECNDYNEQVDNRNRDGICEDMEVDEDEDLPANMRCRRRRSPLKSSTSMSNVLLNSSSCSSLASSHGGVGSNPKPFSDDKSGWILCASSYNEELDWSKAIQKSADEALDRIHKSRHTADAACNPGFHKLSSSSGQNISYMRSSSDTSGILEGNPDEIEMKRGRILKELLRSEESYVTCLGECIQLFVQPLLLRQLEGQKMFRQKTQSKLKSSLRQVVITGSSMSSVLSGTAQPTSAAVSVAVAAVPTSAASKRSQGIKTLRKFSAGPLLNGFHSEPKTHSISSQMNKFLVLDADMAIFFSSIDQICTLNTQLLDHLSRHYDEMQRLQDSGQEHHVHRAGAIFNAYAPLFQLYISYASRYQSALMVIESQEFLTFLKSMPEEATLRRLRRYLNMPMDRIPTYQKFLNDLIQYTTPDHLDHGPLNAAIKTVELVAKKIKEVISKQQNEVKIQEIYQKTSLDTLKGKHFVKEGMLRKVCRSKVHRYNFYLLEDAIVYARVTGLNKKKFRMIDLWECRVSDETSSMPEIINAVAGPSSTSQNAFYFFSPLKSFILLAENAEEKATWMQNIQECIHKALSGKNTSAVRVSLRTDALLQEEEESFSLDPAAFVIKNGWLNVLTEDNKKMRRLWISLTMQSLTFSTTFKAITPDENLNIGLCEALPMSDDTYFRVMVLQKATNHKKIYVFETQCHAEREEWLRALIHCISGSSIMNVVEMRRRSLNCTNLAPIFMFNKVSNVCTLCYHSFAVYRPRHHCRLCGCLVCGNCSKRKWTLSYTSSKKASRICDNCAETATLGGNLLSPAAAEV